MGEQNKALILLLILVLLAAVPEIKVSKAQSGTLVVPDDYPTIAEAVEAATENDTIYVKKGTYDGPINQTLVINKTISLIGEDPKETVLNLHPPWILRGFIINSPDYGYDYSIEIQANNVEISGLTIIGPSLFFTTGHGSKINNNILRIYLTLEGSNEYVSQNNFKKSISVYSSRATIVGNNFTFCSLVIASTGNPSCTVYNNIVTNSTGLVSGGNGNIIFNNTVTNCDYGLLIGNYASNNIAYWNILTNNKIGIRAQSGESNNTLYSNYVANNRYGAFVIGGKESVVLYCNNFVDNIEQVYTDSVVVWADEREEKAYNGGVFDNGEEGNYWSDYAGADTDGDGLGDTPYVIDENRQDNYPLMQSFAISGFQPPETTFPTIHIDSPQNKTYSTANVLLNFSWSKSETEETARYVGFWLDDIIQSVAPTFSDSIIDTLSDSNCTTLTDRLSEGTHNITVASPSGTGFVNRVSVQFTVDLTNPDLTILNPTNATYQTDPQIQFTVNEPTSWIGYSLDGQNTVITTENTITLTGLSNGVYNITIYANDTAGNTGTSETFTFTVAKEAEPDTNPTMWTVAVTATALVAAVGAALLIAYTKTRKRPKNRTY